MTCSDCGQATLSPGVCIDCTINRIDDYPRLKVIEKKYRIMSNLLKKNPFQLIEGDLDWIINVATDEDILKLKEEIQIICFKCRKSDQIYQWHWSCFSCKRCDVPLTSEGTLDQTTFDIEKKNSDSKK